MKLNRFCRCIGECKNLYKKKSSGLASGNVFLHVPESSNYYHFSSVIT